MNDDGYVLGVVRATLSDLLGHRLDDIQPQSQPSELGAESFDFLQIALTLEHVFDVVLPHAFALPAPFTVKELADAIDAAIKAKESERSQR